MEATTTVEHEAVEAHAAALTRFPTPQLVDAAAALLPAGDLRDLQAPAPWLQDVEYTADGSAGVREALAIPEGPAFFATVTAGSVELTATDLARRERTRNRQADAAFIREPRVGTGTRVVERVNETTGEITKHVIGLAPDVEQRRVTEWSRKSRRNLVRVLAGVDYNDLLKQGLPCMITLTYPGACAECSLIGEASTCRHLWTQAAPSGDVAKAHLRAFRERFRRRWHTKIIKVWKYDQHGNETVGRRSVSSSFLALWKEEFQTRGAPHFHLLIAKPHGVPLDEFRRWVRETWNDVVRAETEKRGVKLDGLYWLHHRLAGANVDLREGIRMSDPKRIAVYFTKRESYATSKEYQHIVPDEYLLPGNGPGRFWGFWNADRPAATVYVEARQFIWLRRLLRRYGKSQGWRNVGRGGRLQGVWVVVNDGPAFASQLARALALIE